MYFRNDEWSVEEMFNVMKEIAEIDALFEDI